MLVKMVLIKLLPFVDYNFNLLLVIYALFGADSHDVG